jgi:hypothetical protein
MNTINTNTFGLIIRQNIDNGMFCATDYVKQTNVLRKKNGLSNFNLSQYIKSSSFIEFRNELEISFDETVVITQGSGGLTWLHPLLFVKVCLECYPVLIVQNTHRLIEILSGYNNVIGTGFLTIINKIYSVYVVENLNI